MFRLFQWIRVFMNIFEKIYKEGLDRDDETIDVYQIIKIYDTYLTKDVKNFLKFLRGRDNFLYFMMEIPNKINQVHNKEYIESNIINPYYDEELSDEDLYNIDIEVMRDVLLNYYMSEAKDSLLYYETYHENFPFSMYLSNVYRTEFQEIVKKKYVEPIVKNLYPLSANLKNENAFDEDEMIKKFYIKVTENSFTAALVNFAEIIVPKCFEILEPKYKQSFIKHSIDAIQNVESWNGSLSDKSEKNIFNNQKYSSEAKKKWIPVLDRSEINFDKFYVASLAKSLEQYMFGYALKHTIISSSNLESILEKNFYFISEFGPIMNYISSIVKLKSQINYLFIKLLSKNCDLTDIEITFLVNTLKISHKTKKSQMLKIETYKNVEKELPFIDNNYAKFGWT